MKLKRKKVILLTTAAKSTNKFMTASFPKEAFCYFTAYVVKLHASKQIFCLGISANDIIHILHPAVITNQ